MDGKVSYVRPCDAGEGKVIAEVVYSRASDGGSVFDPDSMCDRLSSHPAFSSVKCSVKLGMAGFTYEGKSVVVNRKGSITVRMADDEEDALAAADYVCKVILGVQK